VSAGFASIDPKAFRKKRNLWLAYASEIGAPILRLAAKTREKSPRTDKTKWKRGLILSHTHIGDLLYRTCSLPALREHVPRCEWSYAVTAGTAEVLANNPHVAEVLPVIRGENSWDLVDDGFATLAAREFDVVLCSNTLRHYPDLALASALGIPNRFGFTAKGFSGLITHPVALDFPSSYAEYFRAMAAAAIDKVPDWELRPRLYPAAADEDNANALWNTFEFDDSRPVVACSLRTRQAKGNWPEDVLLAVLENARREREFEIVFAGAKSDASDLHAIAASFPFPSKVLAGETGLLTFAAFLGRCSALLTLDSGPRHIGNAMGVPVIFARNLSHSLVEAGKYCDTETDLAPSVEYLSVEEIERVTRAQPIGLLAQTLLSQLRSSGSRA
jgi:ADP-heptose:LPS heptosyltransferase